MSSQKFADNCAPPAVLDSVRRKASEAARLLDLMGPEPLSDDIFERLTVAIERRRAAVALEVAAWQQARDQLQVVASEAATVADSTWSMRNMCQAEARLDAAISDECVRQGFWDAEDAEGSLNEIIGLVESLQVKWKVNVEQKTALVSQHCQTTEIKRKQLISISEIFKPRCPPLSMTFVADKFFVLEVSSALKYINVYDSSGQWLSEYRLLSQTGSNFLACNPYRLQSCTSKEYLIIIDHSRHRIITANLNGTVVHTIHVDVRRGEVNDAVSTGESLLVCCSSCILIANWSNPTALVLCPAIDYNLMLPVRLSWCARSKALLVVHLETVGSYRIVTFGLHGNQLKLKLRPSVALHSSSHPCAASLLSNELLVAGVWNGSDGVIGWHVTDSPKPLSSLTARNLFPMDMGYYVDAYGVGEIFICDYRGPVLGVGCKPTV